MTLPEVYSTALSDTMTIRVTMQAPRSEANQNGVNVYESSTTLYSGDTRNETRANRTSYFYWFRRTEETKEENRKIAYSCISIRQILLPMKLNNATMLPCALLIKRYCLRLCAYENKII